MGFSPGVVFVHWDWELGLAGAFGTVGLDVPERAVLGVTHDCVASSEAPGQVEGVVPDEFGCAVSVLVEPGLEACVLEELQGSERAVVPLSVASFSIASGCVVQPDQEMERSRL